MKIMFLISFMSSLCFGDKQWDEVLEYTASFGGINVADASLSSKRYINSENKNILKIKFRDKFEFRRGRVNCSLNDNGVWRWFGVQFSIEQN